MTDHEEPRQNPAEHPQSIPPAPAVPEFEETKVEAPSSSFERASFIQEIKELADKLVRDDATRGDLKVLSRTLKELRYAFKVFRPYRQNRKVTIFGSARTPPEHPAYQQT